MENSIDQTMNELSKNEGVVGCVLTDKSGLCLGVKGIASSNSSGMIAAIVGLVNKIEPNSKAPTILLQSDTRQCLIQQQGPVIGAIYKDTEC